MYDADTQNHPETSHWDADSPPRSLFIGQLVEAHDHFEDAALGAAKVVLDLGRTCRVTNIAYDDFTGYGVWLPIAWDFTSIEQATRALSLLSSVSKGYIRLFEGPMHEEVAA